MKNFSFYRKTVADKFWLPKDSKVEVVEYVASLGSFHVCFTDVNNTFVHQYLYLEDFKCICLCVYLEFGEKSHSFETWHDLFITLKSLSNEKL